MIGTSSRRRDAQLLRLRPDARIVNIRGNIDTRLRKAEGQFDGIVLAAAGIRRMGWQDRISEYFPVERVVPSPGQGAMRFKPGPGVTPPLSWRALTTQASPPQSVSNGRSWPRSAWAAPSRLAPTPRGQAMDTAWSRCSPMPRAIASRSPTSDSRRGKNELTPLRSRRACRPRSGTLPARSLNLKWHGWNGPEQDLKGARIVTRHAGRPVH